MKSTATGRTRTATLRATLLFVLAALAACTLPSALRAGGFGPPIAGAWRNLGPDGGTMRTLAIDPADPLRVYAGGIGGVFRSLDGGATWAPANRGLTARAGLSTVVQVDTLVLDRNHPSTLYAGLSADGVAKSTDGGTSWSHVDSRLGNLAVSALALDPRDGNRIFAATFNGLYRSGDGGATWRRLSRGLPEGSPAHFEAVVLDPVRPQIAYAVVDVGDEAHPDARRVFKSINGGAIWHSISSGPLAGRSVVALAVDPTAPEVLYAATRTGLLRSDDGGGSWRQAGIGEAVFSLLPHPTRRGTIYAGLTDGVVRSSDAGASWAPAGHEVDGFLVYALAFSPASPRTLFAATSLAPSGSGAGLPGGVFKTTNAAVTWRFSSRGIQALSARILAIDPLTPDTLWLSTDAGLYKSLDRGETWAKVAVSGGCPSLGPLSLVLDPNAPQTAYLAANGPTLQYYVCATHDGGASWNVLLSTPDEIFEVRLDPREPSTLYAAGKGIRKSVDRGATWTVLGGEPARFQIYDLLASEAPPTTLYAVGTRPTPFLAFEILRSADGGASWENRGSPTGSGYFNSLAVDPDQPETLYVTDFGTLLASADGGLHWSQRSGAFFHRPGDIAAAGSGRLYFTADGDTVYASDDGGASWSPLGSAPDHVLFSFFAQEDPGDPNRLYVGTSGGSLLAFDRAAPPLPRH